MSAAEASGEGAAAAEASQALRVLRPLSRHWFAESALVEWHGRRYLHKRFQLPLAGRWLRALPRALARHEIEIGRSAAGIPGVAAGALAFGEAALLREWVEGRNLRELTRAGERPPDAFFDELRSALAALHARGIAHNDLERKDNLLIDAKGHPVLIDFQIALRCYRGRRRALAAASRWLIAELQRQDQRYLYKRKHKLRPELCSPEELRLANERSLLARAYHPLWRGLHGLKRALVPKGSARLRGSRRRAGARAKVPACSRSPVTPIRVGPSACCAIRSSC